MAAWKKQTTSCSTGNPAKRNSWFRININELVSWIDFRLSSAVQSLYSRKYRTYITKIKRKWRKDFASACLPTKCFGILVSGWLDGSWDGILCWLDHTQSCRKVFIDILGYLKRIFRIPNIPYCVAVFLIYAYIMNSLCNWYSHRVPE